MASLGWGSAKVDAHARLRIAECGGVAAALPEGHTMSERIEERQSWASDIVWVLFYSILVLLLMLLWVYVPA